MASRRPRTPRSTSPSPTAATRSPRRSCSGASEIVPVKPTTQAHSLGIGSPGDGVFVIEAVRGRGGTAASVSDKEIFAGIDLLASTEGLLTEPAGGTTVAVVKKLAAEGRLDPDETVVAIVTGNGLKTLYDHPAKPWPSKVAVRHRDDALRAGGLPARGRSRARQRAVARVERNPPLPSHPIPSHSGASRSEVPSLRRVGCG